MPNTAHGSQRRVVCPLLQPLLHSFHGEQSSICSQPATPIHIPRRPSQEPNFATSGLTSPASLQDSPKLLQDPIMTPGSGGNVRHAILSAGVDYIWQSIQLLAKPHPGRWSGYSWPQTSFILLSPILFLINVFIRD